MIYFCTNGYHPDARDASLYVSAPDAIAAIKCAIETFDIQGDYILPIRAIDCNGNGAATSWSDEKGGFCGDAIERFWGERANGGQK